jgi:hypothetical protein
MIMVGVLITNGVRRLNDVDLDFLEDFCQQYGLNIKKI